MAVNWRLNYCASTNLRQLMANGCKLVTGLLCIYQSRVLWVGAKLRLVSKKKKCYQNELFQFGTIMCTQRGWALQPLEGRADQESACWNRQQIIAHKQYNPTIGYKQYETLSIQTLLTNKMEHYQSNIAHKQCGTLSIQRCTCTNIAIIRCQSRCFLTLKSKCHYFNCCYNKWVFPICFLPPTSLAADHWSHLYHVWRTNNKEASRQTDCTLFTQHSERPGQQWPTQLMSTVQTHTQTQTTQVSYHHLLVVSQIAHCSQRLSPLRRPLNKGQTNK